MKKKQPQKFDSDEIWKNFTFIKGEIWGLRKFWSSDPKFYRGNFNFKIKTVSSSFHYSTALMSVHTKNWGSRTKKMVNGVSRSTIGCFG